MRPTGFSLIGFVCLVLAACGGGGGGGDDDDETPTVTITSNSSAVAYGGSVTLTWSTSGAASCTANGGWTGSRPASGGSESITGLTAASTFALTCTNAAGNTSESVRVTVGARPAAPVTTLSANQPEVVAGGGIVLTWSSTDASACAADGGWSGARPNSGSANIAAIATTMTFRLACTGLGGTSTSSVTVRVVPPIRFGGHDLTEVGGRLAHEGDFAIGGEPAANGLPKKARAWLHGQVASAATRLVAYDDKAVLVDAPLALSASSLAGDYEYWADVQLPAEAFRMMTIATDTSGMQHVFESARIYRPQTIELAWQGGPAFVASGATTARTLLVRNHGPTAEFQVFLSAEPGVALNDDAPWIVLIDSATETAINVPMVIATGLGPLDEIRVNATVIATLDASRFNDAKLTLTIDTP